MDGLAAAQTLASKHFIDDAKKVDDPQKFIRDLAQRYEVTTHFVDFPRVPSHLTQLLTVGTYQQARILGNFQARANSHAGSSLARSQRRRVETQTHARCSSRRFCPKRDKDSERRYTLYEYYRLVRNAFVHSSIDPSRVDREFSDVAGLRSLVERDFGLQAPNPFDGLTFADHILFTRITKYIATDLCRLAPPLTSQELIRVLVLSQEEPRHPLAKILGRMSSTQVFHGSIPTVVPGYLGPTFEAELGCC